MRTKLTLCWVLSILFFTGCHGVIAVGKQKVNLPSYEQAGLDSKNKQYPEKINLSVSLGSVPRIESGFVLGHKNDVAGRKQGCIYTPDALGEWFGKAYKTELGSYGYDVKLCSEGELKRARQNGIHIDVLYVKQYHRSVFKNKVAKVTQLGFKFDIYYKGEVVDTFKEDAAGIYKYSPLGIFNPTAKLEKSLLVTLQQMTKKSIPQLDSKLQKANMITLHRYAQKAKDEVALIDDKLIINAKTVLRIKNKTGFPDPVIDKSDLQVSMSREVTFPLPDSISVSDPRNPSAAAMAEVDTRKRAYLSNKKYRLSCAKRFKQGPYNGFITCPAYVREHKGKLRPEVTVTLTSVSKGLRFPDFTATDRRLKATITNGQLFLMNLTDKYMEISTLSVYGGEEIQDNDLNISLSPYAKNKKPISFRNLVRYNKDLLKVFTFDDIRRQDISGRTIKFGLAVKYKTGSGGNFETFHSVKKVPLGRLISH